MPVFSIKPDERIIGAVVKLNDVAPFFGHVLNYFKFVETDLIDTIGVSKDLVCLYNPDYISTLSGSELKGVLLHEAGHVIFEHLNRLYDRNPMIWNFACDVVINEVLTESGFILPLGAVSASMFGIDNVKNMSAEDVYDIIMKEFKNKAKQLKTKMDIMGGSNKDGSGSGRSGRKQSEKKKRAGSCNGDKRNGDMQRRIKEALGDEGELGTGRIDHHVYEDLGNEKLKNSGFKNQDMKEKIKDIVNTAFEIARMKGSLPGNLERMFDVSTRPRISWKTLLRKYVKKELPFDFTWSVPNKKYRHLGLYLPGISKENFEVTIAIDTSGSISEAELSTFFSEIVNIFRQLQNVKLTVVTCDYDVQDVFDFIYNKDELMRKVKIKGGGGTSFIPVFDMVPKLKTQLLVYFTDGYGDFPDKAIVPTIWVITNFIVDPPFGDVVRLTDVYDG